MKNLEYDVLVVGAGPAGSTAARYAAKNGASVLMIEKRPEIGSPVRCGEGISKAWLERVGIRLDRRWVANSVDGAIIYSPNETHFTLDEKMAGNEVGMVIERDQFDKALAEEAARAGADIMLRTAARDVIKENGRVTGVIASSMGEPIRIKARMVIGADGFESQIGRWAGLDTKLAPKDIIPCVQYRMTNLDIDPKYTHFYLGSVAPGGYVWVFPKNDDTANVGIGVQYTKLRNPGDVKRYLDMWIEKHPEISRGEKVDMVAGGVSVNAPLDSVTMDGLMLVGDAGRMIDPITGGGIANGCIAGKEAGEVAALAVESGDVSKEFLQEYEKRWRSKLENTLYRNWMAKEKLVTLSDDTLNKIVETLAETGVEKISVGAILKALETKHPELVAEFADLI